MPKELAGTAIPFVWGDLAALSDLLHAHSGNVAGIMMEPMRSAMPPPGYLEGVKSLAQEHGAVLIFDEVSCGFRPRIGGVQEYVGVTPDMTVLAKAISNGYPMGAVVGSRAVMEPASRMFISSSYWSDNLGMVASLTTIRELQRRKSAERFEKIGSALIDHLNQALADVGLPGSCGGMFWNPVISLELPDESLRGMVNTIFIQEMARRGVHCNMSFKATLAHTLADIEQTASCAADAFALIKAGLDSGDLVSTPGQRPHQRTLSSAGALTVAVGESPNENR